MAAPLATRDEDIQVAPCTREHRDEQARLFAACFKKPLPGGGLGWRYDASPLGESVSLVAREPDGLAISGYACSPRLALASGDERTLATVGEIELRVLDQTLSEYHHVGYVQAQMFELLFRFVFQSLSRANHQCQKVSHGRTHREFHLW